MRITYKLSETTLGFFTACSIPNVYYGGVFYLILVFIWHMKTLTPDLMLRLWLGICSLEHFGG